MIALAGSYRAKAIKKIGGKSYVLYDVDKWLSGYCYDCIFGCGLRLIISVSKLCGRDSVI